MRHRFTLATDPGIEIQAEFYRPADGKHKALLVLKDSLDPALEPGRAAEIARFRAMADAGTAVMVIAPRPSPPGGEETKSPILGPFYMTELRAEQVGKTVLGMRVDDVIRAVTFFAGGETIDPNDISAVASGHMGLVLLHAAALDPRIKHITIDHVLQSLRQPVEGAYAARRPAGYIAGRTAEVRHSRPRPRARPAPYCDRLAAGQGKSRGIGEVEGPDLRLLTDQILIVTVNKVS